MRPRITELFACDAVVGKRAEFGARAHDAENGIASDHSDDVSGAIVGTGDDGHLVDVGGEKAFEEAEERFVWRGPEDALAWDHHGLHGVVRPFVARDGIEPVDVHHADQAIFGDDEMAAAASAQNFGAILFERDGAADGGNFVAHDVGGAQASKSFANRGLRDAFLRGVQEEKADENAPKTLGDKSLENAKAAEKDHGVGDHAAAGASDARSFREVFAGAPDDGAENPAAIEGETWKKIENRKQKIRGPEPGGNRVHGLVGRKGFYQAEEDDGQEAAGQGARDGDVEFLDGFGGVALDAGDAAEDEKGDGENANFVVLRNDAMGEFVEEQGTEKEQAGESGDAPLLDGRPRGVVVGKLLLENIGDAGKNDDPGGMEIDGYSEDFAEPHSGALRHIEVFRERRTGLPAEKQEAGSRLCSFQGLNPTLLQ